MFSRRFIRHVLPATLALAAGIGAYVAELGAQDSVHAGTGDPVINVMPQFPFDDACKLDNPRNLPPAPRPINPSQGQPLRLNPAEICPNDSSFRVSVVGGESGRLVTRIPVQNGPMSCFQYFAWDPGEEITSGCSGEDGDNLAGYYQREVFIQFYGTDAVFLSVQCGCNANNATPGSPQIIMVTPVPPAAP